jgi:hypothetical protein
MAAALLALIAGSSDVGHAGAWTRKQESFYAKMSFTTLNTDQYHTKDGETITTADFHTWSVNLYGEYGIVDRLTTIVRFPFLRRAGYVTSESYTGIGDLDLGLKYGIITGSTPLAAGISVEFPTGNEEGKGALKHIPGGYIALPTGDGELNTTLSLHGSHSFHPAPAYLSLDVGYNIRTQGFTDEYLVAFQGGVKPIDRLWLQGTLRARGPASTPDATLANGAALGFGEAVQYIAYSLGAAYELLPHVSVSFDAYSAFGRVTNIYSGINLVFGVSLEY